MSALLEEILKRINWPGDYVTRQPDSRENDGMEAGNVYAARAVAQLFETRKMLDVPKDRDSWQQLTTRTQEELALTEAALGVSQEANVELVEGQTKLIELLERVARYHASEFVHSGMDIPEFLPDVHEVLKGVTAIATDASGRLGVVPPQEKQP